MKRESRERATNEHPTASSSTTSAPASGSSPNGIRDVESGITRSPGGRPPSSESGDHDKGALHRFLDLVLRRSQALSVRNPPPSTFKRWIEIYKSSQIGFLPEDVNQIRIAVCGFAMYGIMTLFNNTWELIKNSVNRKVAVMFFTGLFWAVASIAVGFTMSGRTRLGASTVPAWHSTGFTGDYSSLAV